MAKEAAISDDTTVSFVEAKFDRLESKLDKYIKDLLVFGYTSGGYDIPLIKTNLIKHFLDSDCQINLAIKKGNNYICIQTDKLRFLDTTNFLAPEFSYSDYLKAIEVDAEKFFWTYDKFTSLDCLQKTSFPQYEDFYSELKQSNITSQEYQKCKDVWNKHNMTTMKDLLMHYHNEDCRGFCLSNRKAK